MLNLPVTNTNKTSVYYPQYVFFQRLVCQNQGYILFGNKYSILASQRQCAMFLGPMFIPQSVLNPACISWLLQLNCFLFSNTYIKSMLNNSKPTMSSLFNQFEVSTSSADKAECFTQKFSSNSTLDSSCVLPTPDFPPRTEALLSERHTTPTMLSSLNQTPIRLVVGTGYQPLS